MDDPGRKISSACLIMAGGKGTRLTPDKPLLHVGGLPIISRVVRVVTSIFDEVLLVTNTPAKYEFLGLPHVSDEEPGHGPLMGIYSGLRAIRSPMAFVCGADMPFLDADIIRAELTEVGDHDMVIPYPRNLPEFLHGIYRARCLPTIRRNLDARRFKIDLLREDLDVRILDDHWFATQGFAHLTRRAFTNINTAEDYSAWMDQEPAPAPEDPFTSIPQDLLESIRDTLIEDESRYQRQHGATEWSSLWSHSARVAAIAHTIARQEGLDTTSAVLASLLHDVGKFHGGRYHDDDTTEEQRSVDLATELLEDTPLSPCLPEVSRAILSLYRDDASPGDLGAVLHDADRLDKLGYAGVALFFTKNALRARFLDSQLMARASVELTYALHARRTLKTGTGRRLAVPRAARVRSYFEGLLDEWRELGLGTFRIRSADVEGVELLLVVPLSCSCGSPLELETDIKEGIKCRSAIVRYACPSCGRTTDFSFCLPVLRTLLD